MTFQKPRSGTRGGRVQRGSAFTRFVTRVMIRQHRRKGDRFMGMDLLYLTTVGAKSGETRTTPVSRFEDGDNAWLVVASAAGSVRHPAWYHNIASHPDQVWVEFGGRKMQVTVQQLEGPRREEAWERIKAAQPRYAGYEKKTDRVLPILRLTPAQESTPQS